MAQSRLLNELKSLLLELRSVPSAGRLTHPKVHMRVTKSGPSCPEAVVRPRALPLSPPMFSLLWAFRLLAAGLAGATLALRLKSSRCEARVLVRNRRNRMDGVGLVSSVV